MSRPVKFTNCTVVGCGKPHEAKGFCAGHYIRHHWGDEMRRGLVSCGWLSVGMVATIDAMFSNGPLHRHTSGWSGPGFTISLQSAAGLISRHLAQIKGRYPHETLNYTAAGADLAGRINGAIDVQKKF